MILTMEVKCQKCGHVIGTKEVEIKVDSCLEIKGDWALSMNPPHRCEFRYSWLQKNKLEIEVATITCKDS